MEIYLRISSVHWATKDVVSHLEVYMTGQLTNASRLVDIVKKTVYIDISRILQNLALQSGNIMLQV